MTHTCHFPTCSKPVAPKLWGCRKHWFMLPKHLRDKIWKTYRPGQEIDKNPSREYLNVAIEVDEYCIQHLVPKEGMTKKEAMEYDKWIEEDQEQKT